MAAVVLAVSLTSAAGVAWYALQGRTETSTAAGTTPPPEPATDPVLPRPTQPAATVLPGPVGDAGAALADQVAADRDAAEAVIGSWLPQISSKYAGLEVDGIVYDDDRILAEFRVAQQRYGAILVRSEDYSTFQRPGLWVALVPHSEAEPGDANAWCDSQGFPTGDCFAKRLSHTEGPAGNTLHRS